MNHIFFSFNFSYRTHGIYCSQTISDLYARCTVTWEPGHTCCLTPIHSETFSGSVWGRPFFGGPRLPDLPPSAIFPRLLWDCWRGLRLTGTILRTVQPFCTPIQANAADVFRPAWRRPRRDSWFTQIRKAFIGFIALPRKELRAALLAIVIK